MNDGGSAFPGLEHTSGYGCARRNSQGEWESFATGMSLRDYLAAAAITGLLACDTEEKRSVSQLARIAYDQADVMLKIRDEAKTPNPIPVEPHYPPPPKSIGIRTEPDAFP